MGWLRKVRDAVGGDEGSASVSRGPIDEEAVVDEFERLLELDGVTVEGERSTLVEDFAAVVSRYAAIEPDVRELKERISDGDGVSLLDRFENEDEIERFDAERGVTDELDAIRETMTRLFERVDIGDSVDESAFGESERLDGFLQRLRNVSLLFASSSDSASSESRDA